uniref:Protein FAR1-RELATED SEQUENCE n=1 Tax=Lactuca sativa TaxID=4236 RepID=A0A9R1X5F0_LACSA|nr:hypothetical protein LSAT_V11C700356210 [Lactuca sativa]
MIPDVHEEFKPTKSLRLKDVDEGVNFYKRYAEKAGFDVRINTLRKKHRYEVYNRIGKPKINSKKHNTIYRATNYKAKIIEKCVKGMDEYRFDKFRENHNYDLEDTFHLKSTRTLSYSEKEFILRDSTVKMGVTKAYKLKSTLKGGFQHVWGKVVYYRNFKRDIRSIIGFIDAQLIMNKMNDWKTNYPIYSFIINAMKIRYAFVFVPFTFIDYHKSFVTVGVGLLSTEDVDSQSIDCACAYHEETAKKILILSLEFLKSMDFKKRFNKLVWDMYIECDVFELKYESLMKKINLEDERWFKDSFENKEACVPRYFNDFPRCRLMKTTSRSENNSIEKQLYTQCELDHKTKGAHYSLKSPRMIEQHTTSVYTSKLLFEVQKETYKGGWYCDVKDLGEGDVWKLFKVMHRSRNLKWNKNMLKKKRTTHVDILIDLVYCVDMLSEYLMKKNIDEILDKYILRRWRKNLSRDHFDEKDADVRKLVNEVFFNIEYALDILRDDKQKLASLAEKTQILLNDVKSNSSNKEPITNYDVLERLHNVTIPEEVEIFVPYKRLIGDVEKSIMNVQKNTIKCLVCGKREPHNNHTCPSRFVAEKRCISYNIHNK